MVVSEQVLLTKFVSCGLILQVMLQSILSVKLALGLNFQPWHVFDELTILLQGFCDPPWRTTPMMRLGIEPD